MQVQKVIIIGSGPAGYSAALYAARSGLSPIIISGIEEGGQLMTTTDVDNWPGESNGIMGPKLMENMKNHVLRFDTKIINDYIIEVDLSKRPFTLIGEKDTYKAETLIVATGARAKYLGLASEEKFKGRGVSACATCDGFFYKNQKVAVVGGGNTAIEEALFLSNIASEVVVIHRRNKFSGEQILIDNLLEKNKTGNIKIEWNTEIDEVLGDNAGVNKLRLKNNENNTTKEIDVLGIFIAIGHQPNTDIFNDKLIMENGYIKVNGGNNGNVTATNIPGVFAAGDCADHVYRQAVTSAGSGCQAALDVKKFLETQN